VSAVRSRRWTVEVSVAGERRDWPKTKDPVEAVWIDYWQRAGSPDVELDSVSLWAERWGDEIAQLTALDVRDSGVSWLTALVAEHRPDPGGAARLVEMRLRALVTDWPAGDVPVVTLEQLTEILEGRA
jgi:hypothetical protein